MRGEDRLDAAHVIGVVMGDENRHEGQALVGKMAENRRGIARIDHGGVAIHCGSSQSSLRTHQNARCGRQNYWTALMMATFDILALGLVGVSLSPFP